MALLVLGALAAACLLAAAPSDSFTIPAGTTLHTRLTAALSTKANDTGDPFTVEVTDPVFSGGEEVIPAGSTVQGKITFLKREGAKGKGEMRLVAETIITPDGTKYDITAGLQEAQGPSGTKVKDSEGTVEGPGKSKKTTAIESGVGAGVGAGAGAIAAGGSGALYGLAIGAIAGAVHSLAKKHAPAVLPMGTEMTFTISRAIVAKKIAQPPDPAPKNHP